MNKCLRNIPMDYSIHKTLSCVMQQMMKDESTSTFGIAGLIETHTYMESRVNSFPV